MIITEPALLLSQNCNEQHKELPSMSYEEYYDWWDLEATGQWSQAMSPQGNIAWKMAATKSKPKVITDCNLSNVNGGIDRILTDS